MRIPKLTPFGVTTHANMPVVRIGGLRDGHVVGPVWYSQIRKRGFSDGGDKHHAHKSYFSTGHLSTDMAMGRNAAGVQISEFREVRSHV